MRRLQASDFDQRVLDLYDGYAHGQLSKREFLERAALFTAAGVSAAAVLESLQPNYALAAQVAPDDPSIETSWITYASPEGYGPTDGLIAKPAGAEGKLPAVLVVHENRGLNPYIRDVVRRCAKAGYLALGPDGLTSIGGYPGDDDEGRRMQSRLDRDKLLNDFLAAFDYLESHPDCTGRVGAVGFCYGGAVCNALAVEKPTLAASVPFYGRQAAAEDVPKIRAPLMLHYAGLDERINSGWPDFQKALMEHDKAFSVHFYPGVNHGFHNDTTPRYSAEAAKLAWNRTLAFFRTYLS